MDSEYSPVCSDIEDELNENDDSTAEKSKNDLEKQDLSVMKLLEEYSQNEMENAPPLPMDEDDTEMDLSGNNK